MKQFNKNYIVQNQIKDNLKPIYIFNFKIASIL